MSIPKLRPSKAKELLSHYIANRLPVLLSGAPGVGKSDIVAQAAILAGADLIISHPVVSDPTDAKGLPWPGKDGESATFLPFGELARAINATQPTVWFLDDLGQASPAVQASFMQLLLARKINGHVLPDCVTFVAATNRRNDRAGVQGILSPVKSRFAAIVEVAPNVADWCAWAVDNDLPPELIAFHRLRGEELLFPATTTENRADDMENFPCPRTWYSVAKAMRLGLSDDLEYPAYAGAVGEGAAIELTAFLKMFRDLPSPDAVLMDPDNAMIPEGPSGLYAISAAIAARANDMNCGRAFRYAERLRNADHGDFAALLVRDAVRRKPTIQHTPEYTKLMASGTWDLFI